MVSQQVGKNMFSSFYKLCIVGVFLITSCQIKADEDSCGVFELKITNLEFGELFPNVSYRGKSPIDNIYILGLKGGVANDFDKNLELYINESFGDFNLNSNAFLKLLSSVNSGNLKYILSLYGNDGYNKLTNVNFKNSKIRLRYKDVISYIVMIKYGENLWFNKYPYPYWNIPMSKDQSNFETKKIENNLNLSSLKMIKPIPTLSYGPTWIFKKSYNYNALLNGMYDKNFYYLWSKELNKNDFKMGEWQRDLEWFSREISSYKGGDEVLLRKISILKNRIDTSCLY